MHNKYRKNKNAAIKQLYLNSLQRTRELFNKAKIDFYEKLVVNGGLTPTEFYNLMRFKRTSRRPFPTRMIFNGTWFKGGEIVQVMAKSLLANLDMQDERFVCGYESSRSVLWDIYAED